MSEIKTGSPVDLHKILRLHGLWLRGNDAEGRRAVLRGADLTRAVLTDAVLTDAVLTDADLRGADLTDAVLPHFALCPETGPFVATKKLADGTIATLEIPAEARRTSSLVGRKCRAEYVRVIALSGDALTAVSARGGVYTVGEITRPDAYDDDIRVECSNGIHFFITRREAEEYEP